MPSKTGIQLIVDACRGGPRTETQILRATGLSTATFHRLLDRFLGERLRATRLRGRTYYEAHAGPAKAKLRSEPDLRCTTCNSILDHRILENLQQALRPCPVCHAWNWHLARTDGYLNRPAQILASGGNGAASSAANC